MHHRDIDGFTALHRACQFPTEDAPDVVRDLIRYGAEVDARTESGLTPLLLACQFLTPSSVSVVRILLENGADPAAADDKGNTALHALACQAWSFTTLREAGLFEGNAKAIGTVEKKRKGCSREKKVRERSRRGMRTLFLDLCKR